MVFYSQDGKAMSNELLGKQKINETTLVCDPVRDRNALIAIYNALDGPNWKNNTNWNTTAPIEDWYGVSTNSSGCVTSLDLNDTNDIAGKNNLSGVLPNEIGDLTELVNLDFAIGDISGTIPSTITNLTNLANLNLLVINFLDRYHQILIN